MLDPEELKSEPAKEVGGEQGHTHTHTTGPPFLGLQGCRCFSPQKWRPFCLRFEGVVEDFNYGTLLRLDCRKDYTEENTIFGERGLARPGWAGRAAVQAGASAGPARRAVREAVGKLDPRICSFKFLLSPLLATRIQFFAIEIARNREGCNSVVYSSAREPAAAAAEEAASG